MCIGIISHSCFTRSCSVCLHAFTLVFKQKFPCLSARSHAPVSQEVSDGMLLRSTFTGVYSVCWTIFNLRYLMLSHSFSPEVTIIFVTLSFGYVSYNCLTRNISACFWTAGSPKVTLSACMFSYTFFMGSYSICWHAFTIAVSREVTSPIGMLFYIFFAWEDTRFVFPHSFHTKLLCMLECFHTDFYQKFHFLLAHFYNIMVSVFCHNFSRILIWALWKPFLGPNVIIIKFGLCPNLYCQNFSFTKILVLWNLSITAFYYNGVFKTKKKRFLSK